VTRLRAGQTGQLPGATRNHEETMSTITLGPDLGIENAAAVHQQLTPLLTSRRVVKLEIPRVDRLHTATLQVLCAFIRDRAAARRRTRLDDPPVELREAARLLGLTAALGLTVDAPSGDTP